VIAMTERSSRHPSRRRLLRPVLRRVATVAAVAGAIAILVPAAPAQAHPPGIQPAVDYRTRIIAVTPRMAGLHARYVADGSRLELRNDSGRTIEVLGYQGEPMLQVRPNGVWQNTRAPSLYVDKLGVAINPATDPHAEPHWQQISDRPLARWQDHRALWHGNPPPPVRADPTHAHRVSNWRVPLRDGATSLAITGTLDWVPPPQPGTWWLLVLVVAATISILGLVSTGTHNRAGIGRAALAGAAFAAGLTTVGYPVLVVADNAEPGANAMALALVSQVVPVLLGMVLIAAGVLVLARRDVGDFALAFGGVFTALFVGAPNAAVLSHAVAPITADGSWGRLSVVAILGGGAGLALAGGRWPARRWWDRAREDVAAVRRVRAEQPA
jgi:hypothetical protein